MEETDVGLAQVKWKSRQYLIHFLFLFVSQDEDEYLIIVKCYIFYKYLKEHYVRLCAASSNQYW